jgi:Uma2 family endonuclease
MAFAIDDALLPATLTALPMTDEQFAGLCARHPDLHFETTGEGEIIVSPPTYSLTGVRNSRICRKLDTWAEQDNTGLATDSSTGFVLPDGARRSPDAAWTRKSRIAQLPPESRDRYWRLCPDFVIELLSGTDRPRLLREKMDEWIANGAQLAWMIEPEQRKVTIYRPGSAPETLIRVDRIIGEGLLKTFELDLTFIWNPLAA